MPPSTCPVVVHKFGGAALADAAAIANVGMLLGADTTEQRRVVVTSALQGVTNQLLAAISRATEGDQATARSLADQLRTRHLEVALGVFGDDAISAEHDTLLASINAACDELVAQLDAMHADAQSGLLSDAILAHGERLAARLVCVMLER